MSDQLTAPERTIDRVAEVPPASPRRAAPHRAFPWRAIGIRSFILLLIGAMVVVVATQWDWWVGSARLQTTDDAYLTANLTPLAAKVPGYVRRVVVDDFQKVKAGDLLVEVVDDDYRAQVGQAEGDAAAAAASIDTINQQKTLQQAMIAEARASIQASEADLTRYHLETIRQQTLLASGIAGTRQVVEQAIDNEQRATAMLAVNRAQLAQRMQQIGVLDSQQKQAEATLAVRNAALQLARINLAYTRITAPVDGMVSQRQVQEGQFVSAGTQVISIVPLPNVWVIANYKETQMTRIRVGQPASVTVDTFPGAVLHGHVAGWSPASGAQFSLLPPDNATGNFTKVVQRIPVKIVLDPDPALEDLLRPGMSAIPTIDTR
jgi:membrane fusion protein (multidrug efflux system)